MATKKNEVTPLPTNYVRITVETVSGDTPINGVCYLDVAENDNLSERIEYSLSMMRQHHGVIADRVQVKTVLCAD